MNDAILIASIFLSGIGVGLMAMLYRHVQTARAELKVSIAEYNEILRKVSEMNLSAGNKILQLEEKISTLEFWKQTSMPSQPKSFTVK